MSLAEQHLPVLDAAHRGDPAALNFDPWDDARAEAWLAGQDTAAIKSRLHRARAMAREYLIG